jgi:hypothetical protein
VCSSDLGEFDNGVFLDPADMHVRVTGNVRADRIAAACPLWVQRDPGPGGEVYICDVAVSFDCMEDFRGDLTDLLDGLLRGVLEQFVTVRTVRVTFWEGDEPPDDRKLILRFKVRGERREGA